MSSAHVLVVLQGRPRYLDYYRFDIGWPINRKTYVSVGARLLVRVEHIVPVAVARSSETTWLLSPDQSARGSLQVG